MNPFIKRTTIGFSLAMLVVALMLAWRMHVKASRPAHMQAIATELASIGKFMLPIPMPDKGCDKLLFGQSTDQGVGVFLLNIADGQKQLVYEQPRKFYDPVKFKIFGWAPDDSLFAFQQHDSQEWAGSRVVICDGNTGKTITTVNVDGKMMDGNYVFGIISSFVWLSPHAFAYIRIVGGDTDLVVVEKGADGKWVSAEPVKISAKNPLGMLVALSDHSVVWQEGNTLQSLDVTSGSTTQIFELTTNELEGFSFSPDSGKFLLLCGDQAGENLFVFQPEGKLSWGRIQAGSLTNIYRISSQPRSVEKALWINHEQGIAYMMQDLGQETLFILTNSTADPMALGARGSVISFNVSGNQIFITGSLTNEPPGIWQYDVASGSLNCIYSSQEHPFKYAKYVVPLCKTVTNASGRLITYHLWEPAQASSGKKCAVLLGQSPYNWQVYPELTVNGGDFFVNVDRPSFLCLELNNWAEDVTAVYGELAKDPRIDMNAVYVYGTSAESGELASFVDQKPNQWKGIILITPENFPNLSGLHFSKILIDDGMDDKSTIEGVKKYQQAAAEVGVPLTLVLHKDTAHIYWSIATQREEAQQLAKFLFGD
jgi:hypothetical protein